jgi:hypothetical protein
MDLPARSGCLARETPGRVRALLSPATRYGQMPSGLLGEAELEQRFKQPSSGPLIEQTRSSMVSEMIDELEES